MKKDKKSVMIVDNLEIFDDIKIAGVKYRVDSIHEIGGAYLIYLHNARRPSLEAMLTVQSNTLMHVWSPIK